MFWGEEWGIFWSQVSVFSVREFGFFRTGNLVLGVSDGTEKDASF